MNNTSTKTIKNTGLLPAMMGAALFALAAGYASDSQATPVQNQPLNATKNIELAYFYAHRYPGWYYNPGYYNVYYNPGYYGRVYWSNWGPYYRCQKNCYVNRHGRVVRCVRSCY